MHYPTRRLSVMLAGAVAAGLAAKTAHAQYNIVTDVSVPVYSGDGVTGSTVGSAFNTSSAFVKYTTLSVNGGQNAFPISSVPNGDTDFPLTGTMSGTVVGGTVSDTTGWAYDPTYGFRLIGYYSESSTGAHSGPTITGANSLGIIGSTPHSSSSNATTGLLGGADPWFYNNTSGTSTLLTGLSGSAYTYSYQSSAGTVAGTVQSSAPKFLTLGGQVSGTSARFAGVAAPSGNAGDGLGTAAWVEQVGGSPTEIGLLGNGYNYYVSGTVAGFNSSGAYTSTAPYSGTYYAQTLIGQDANGDIIGNTPAELSTGLGGAYYSPYSPSTGKGAYQSLGQDGWIYNGSSGAPTTTAIGLSYSTNTPAVAGFSSVAWAYSDEMNSNTSTGLVGYNVSTGMYDAPSNSLNTFRSTTLVAISKTGQVAGDSAYFNSSSTAVPTAQGQDAFVYSLATGKYTQVGLLANGFNPSTGTNQSMGTTSFVNAFGSRTSTPVAINDNNQVIGSSAVYIGAGNVTYTNGGPGASQAAWIANASTGATTQIGLWNQSTSVHVAGNGTYSPGYGVYNDYPLFLTESGYVAGYTARYNSSNGKSLGSDGWLYDPNNQQTYPIDLTDELNTTQYVAENIEYLSETGVVVGELTYNSSNPYTYQAFAYSESGGFALLGNEITGGLGAPGGYSALIEAYYDDTSGTVYSTAYQTGTSTVNAVVSVVPEPTSLSVLALGGIGLLRRRRRAGVRI